MKARIAIACTVLLLAGASSTGADTIVLRDGDALSGTLVTIAEGVVLFRTKLAGQMLLPSDEVVSLNTDSEVRVALADESEVLGRFVTRNGSMRLVSADGSGRVVGLAEVTNAVPDPSGAKREPAEADASAATPLQGTWETGVQARFGGDDYADLFGKLALSQETGRYAFRSSFLLERADEDRFPRLFRGEAEWRLAPGRQTYPVLAIGVERDTDKALSLRTDLDLSMGRTFVKTDAAEFEASAGVGAAVEQHDAGSVWDEERGTVAYLLRHGRHEQRKSRQELNLRLTLRYKHALFKNGTFAESISLYPSLSDPGDLRGFAESALLYSLHPRLKLKLNLLVDYDEAPEFREIEPWRTSVGASLLWDF